MHFLLYYTGRSQIFFFFFFNDTATTEIYTLSLHDALPICTAKTAVSVTSDPITRSRYAIEAIPAAARSEEHTSELQSPCNLVCRLLLEKKKKNINYTLPRNVTTADCRSSLYTVPRCTHTIY